MNDPTAIESAETKGNLFDPDGTFQYLIVPMLLHTEPEILGSVLGIIKPEYFGNPYEQAFIRIIIEFYSTYKRAIQLDEFVAEVERFISDNPRFSVDEFSSLLSKHLDQMDGKPDYRYVRDRLREFAKFETIKNALIESAKVLKLEKKVNSAVYILESAISRVKESGSLKSSNLETVELGDIEREKVEWFWPNRIPKGKLSLIVGDPEVGKSFFTMFLTAQVTQGRPWPDNPEHSTDKGKVIILTAEDGLADTIVPRVEDNGGDKSLVTSIQGVRYQDSVREFNIARDLEELERLVIRLEGVQLIIIDPLSAYLGTGKNIDTYKEKDVRSVLTPLARLAEKHKITILGVLHLNKNQDSGALYRVSGSLAFVAGPRSVWLIEREKRDGEDQSLRYFAKLKANLSINPETLAFKIEKGVVVFQEMNQARPTANELLVPPAPGREAQATNNAIRFLKNLLMDGPIEYSQIRKVAKENGVSNWALYKAQKVMKIRSVKNEGGSSGCQWELPENERERDLL